MPHLDVPCFETCPVVGLITQKCPESGLIVGDALAFRSVCTYTDETYLALVLRLKR